MYPTSGLAFDHPELPKIVNVYSDAPQNLASSDQGCYLGTGQNIVNTAYAEDRHGFVRPNPSNSQDAMRNRNLLSLSNKQALCAFIRNRRAKLNAEPSKVRSLHALKQVYQQIPSKYPYSKERRQAFSKVRSYGYPSPQIPSQALNVSLRPAYTGSHSKDLLYIPLRDVQEVNQKAWVNNPSPLSTEASDRFFSLLTKYKNIDWPRVYESAKILLRPRYDSGLPVTRQDIFDTISSVIKLFHGNHQAGSGETPATTKNDYRQQPGEYSLEYFHPRKTLPVPSELGTDSIVNSDVTQCSPDDLEQKQVPFSINALRQPVLNLKQEPYVDGESYFSNQSVHSSSCVPNQSIKLEHYESVSSLFETLTSMEGRSSQDDNTWQPKFFCDQNINQEDVNEVHGPSEALNDHQLTSNDEKVVHAEGAQGRKLNGELDQMDYYQSTLSTNFIAEIAKIKKEEEIRETEDAIIVKREDNFDSNIFDVLGNL